MVEEIISKFYLFSSLFGLILDWPQYQVQTWNPICESIASAALSRLLPYFVPIHRYWYESNDWNCWVSIDVELPCLMLTVKYVLLLWKWSIICLKVTFSLLSFLFPFCTSLKQSLDTMSLKLSTKVRGKNPLCLTNEPKMSKVINEWLRDMHWCYKHCEGWRGRKYWVNL